MNILEQEAKSILRKHKKIDSWFITHYGINLYRGCSHNCVYCDGRDVKYQVDGEFGRDVVVKTNALQLLDKELDRSRRRKPMPKSFMLLGGGVCDAYQEIEKKYRLSRGTLKLCLKHEYPVHVLTKSTLILDDIQLIQEIHEKHGAVVSFSFSSTMEDVSSIFEPGVPSPAKRLEAITELTHAGIPCGIFLMPVIPFLTDSTGVMEKTLRGAKSAGAQYAIFGTMTLKPGRQKEYFMNVLEKHYPELHEKYTLLYRSNSKYGEATKRYNHYANLRFAEAAHNTGIPVRVPPEIYQYILSDDDKVLAALEHIDYVKQLKGEKTSLGYAAYMLSKAEKPVTQMTEEELLKVSGVTQETMNLIEAIKARGLKRSDLLV
ncbi:MAG: radical SAM protein [Spirochaetia bacterium]